MDLITTVLFVIIVLTAVIFLVRKKVLKIMTKGIKILFVLFVTVGLISLFAPQLYDTLADGTLKRIGTYDTVKSIDKSISLDSLKEAPQNLWNDIKKIFNPQDNSSSNQSGTTENKGLLEGSIYSGMVTFLAFIYRALGIGISIGGLVLITYLSYSMASVTDLDEMRSKYARLERRVEELESISN